MILFSDEAIFFGGNTVYCSGQKLYNNQSVLSIGKGKPDEAIKKAALRGNSSDDHTFIIMELKSFYIVRFPDCDPLAHLNNSRYLDYFLNAREDHLRENFDLLITDFLQQGMGWVVRQHEIQYLRPAVYNEKICITSQIIQLETSSLVVELKMLDEKEVNLKAILWTHFTCIDPKTGKRKDHTPEFIGLATKLGIGEVNMEAGISERVKALRSLA